MTLDGKTIFITGGASGLGAATARICVEAGARVCLVDLASDRGEALADELGDPAIFSRTDVTDAEAVGAAVEQTLNAFGHLDGAVNCAGIGTPGKVIGREGPLDLDLFRKVIDVNLVGTFNVIRLAAQAMTENDEGPDGERGVIVNTASVAAYDGQIGQAAYSASKGGIASMTLPIARELAYHGIRVVTIAPGIFDTPLLAGLGEKVRKSLEDLVPFPKRLGKPSEFGTLVRQIIENRMLNGEVIRLDGALRMPPK